MEVALMQIGGDYRGN